jgi:hypothetical protein
MKSNNDLLNHDREDNNVDEDGDNYELTIADFHNLSSIYEECYSNNQMFNELYLQTGRYSQEFVELELLGTGGYGSVFKAQNKYNDNLYAIKKIFVNGLYRFLLLSVCYNLNSNF